MADDPVLAAAQGGEPGEELALPSPHEALALARERGDKPGQVAALLALCQELRRSGVGPGALDTVKEMRSLCHELKAHEGEAQALVDIANIHLVEHEAKPAIRAALAAARILVTRRAPGEARLPALVAAVEGYLQLLGDYAKAAIIDKRLQKEIDAAAARAYEVSEEAIRLAEPAEDFGLRAQALYWRARMLLVVGKEQDAVEAAGKARILFQKVQDPLREGDALLVLAQGHHKLEPSKPWAANAAHDALELFQALGDEAAKERTYLLFQDLGLALRVAGGVAATAAVMDGDASAAAAAPAPGTAAVSEVAAPKGLDAEMVLQTVQEMARASIGLEDELFLESPLMDSGMDSLTAVSFRNGLQQNLGVKLPSSLMFDYPTMKEVANRIVELSLEEDA